MRNERLTLTSIGDYQQFQLKPCTDCDLEPETCGMQVRASIPVPDTEVLCKKRGIVEIIDFSTDDQVTRIKLLRSNGKPETNRGISRVAEAAL